MGLMSFMKEAGQKLFGHKDAEAAQKQAEAAPNDEAAAAKAEALNKLPPPRSSITSTRRISTPTRWM